MAIPNSLRSIKPFVVISKQFEKKDPVISYYVMLHALSEGIKLSSSAPDGKPYLLGLMDQTEMLKRVLKESQPEYLDEVTGQAHVEETASQLFDAADKLDRASKFSKSLAKMFFTASQIFTSLSYFGELSEEIEPKKKYAKWKAVELDKCLKNGTTPTPGPPGGFDDPLTDDPLHPPGPSSGVQPGPYSSVQPGYGFDQPGPSSYGYGQQPAPVGFDLPPVPSSQQSYQPQLPPEIKPVPKPRQESHTPPTVRAQPPPTMVQPPPTMAQPPPTVAQPPPTMVQSGPTLQAGGPTVKLGPDDTAATIKYCKYAISSLDYDDQEGAVDYLVKALNMLRTGKES